MDLHSLKEHVDARLDRLEDKIDKFSDSTTTNTTDIRWLKGHVNIVTTIVLAAAGWFAVAYLTSL